MKEYAIMASDQINDIRNWLNSVEAELTAERIDLTEISDIERVYDIIKDKEL